MDNQIRKLFTKEEKEVDALIRWSDRIDPSGADELRNIKDDIKGILKLSNLDLIKRQWKVALDSSLALVDTEKELGLMSSKVARAISDYCKVAKNRGVFAM